MTIPAETQNEIDAFLDRMQLSAWRGKSYAEYQREYEAGTELLAMTAADALTAEEIRMQLKDAAWYEGDEPITDGNGIIIFSS